MKHKCAQSKPNSNPPDGSRDRWHTILRILVALTTLTTSMAALTRALKGPPVTHPVDAPYYSHPCLTDRRTCREVKLLQIRDRADLYIDQPFARNRIQ